MSEEGREMAAGSALGGERVVFAGRLASMTRKEAWRIVRQLGGTPANLVSSRTSLLVVGMAGWPLAPDGRVSDHLRRADQLKRTQSIRIIAETQFLDTVGAPAKKASLGRTYPADAIRSLLNVSQDRLDDWQRDGLIAPCDGRYEFQSILSLTALADLIARGVAESTIRDSLRRLALLIPGTDAALRQLRALTATSPVVLSDLRSLEPAPDGQLLLGFGGEPEPALQIIRFRAERPAAGLTADEWFERGVLFEEDERFNEAAEAYRKAIALRGQNPEAFFNLGTILQAQNKLDAAVEMYQIAAGQDPSMACAWYNVADIQENQGDLPAAIASLKTALDACPTFADAHYNLALIYEHTSEPEAARRHWREYARLDPSSEWGQLARGRIAAPLK